MRLGLQPGVSKTGQPTVAVSVVRTVTAIEARTIGFGNLNGPSTLLTLNHPLIKHAMTDSPGSDVRDYRIHEVTSPPLTLRPVSSPASSGFANGTAALRFWGTVSQAQALAGRRLYLSHTDGRSVELVCTNEAGDFATSTPDVPKMWSLSFDRPPKPFVRADFDEATPTVTAVSYTHLRAHETALDLVCRLLLAKKTYMTTSIITDKHTQVHRQQYKQSTYTSREITNSTI